MTTKTPHRLPLCAALVLLSSFTLTPTTARSQSFENGYAHRTTTLPNGSGQALSLGASSVYFTGTDLVLARGTNKRTLLQFTKAVFGSFTIRVASDALLFGESSNGGIWWVPLASTAKPKLLGTIKLNYAAVLYNQRWAIVSAKTGGFAAKHNDLIAIDLNTGKQDTIAILPGASGPLATGHNGDLYYVTASLSFPPPKGFSDLLRFPARTVRSAFGSSQLGITDAKLLVGSIDAAGALARDGDDDLFLTDWVNGTLVEISDANSKTPRRSVLAKYSSVGVSPSSLQFVRSRRLGSQQFEPFQAIGSGHLIVHESSYGSTSQLRHLMPQRAQLGVPTGRRVAKARSFELVARHGRKSGTGFMVLGLGAHLFESVFHRPFEAPILWSNALRTPLLIAPVSFDSTGEARLKLFNPGFPTPLALTAQAYFENTVAAGSSQAITLILR